MRKFIICCGALLFIIISIPLIWITHLTLNDPAPNFGDRKGSLVLAKQEGMASFEHFDYHNYTLKSSSGLDVLLSVRRPTLQNKSLPLVILLGGYRTGRNAVRLIDTKLPLIVAAISYPYDADPSARGLAIIPAIPNYARAFRDTTPAILLALDYLAAQPYVDPNKIELVGISLGAFLVSAPGALDKRFRRIWLVHGAANTQQLIAYNLRYRIGNPYLREVTAKILNLLSSAKYIGPKKWLPKITAERLIIINAKQDEALPRNNILALHKMLPKDTEIIWTQGMHIKPDRKDIIRRLTNIIFQRVVAHEQ